MKTTVRNGGLRGTVQYAVRFGIVFGWLIGLHGCSGPPATRAAPAITVKGVAPDGTLTTISAYRWTIEKDVTKASVPGQHATRDSYSFSMHSSYMPVVAAGKMA